MRFEKLAIRTPFFIFNDNRIYVKLTETTAKLFISGEIVTVDTQAIVAPLL